MRSCLVVGAAADDLAHALRSGADAVVVDLPEDADLPLLTHLHEALAAILEQELRPLVFLRLAGITAQGRDAALETLMAAGPDGIVLAGCASGADVQHLGAILAVHEAERDLADGQTAIVAEIGGVARSVLALDSFVGCSARLLALVWNAKAFADELGLESPEAVPAITARGLTVIAAKAADVAAFDMADGNEDGFRQACLRARRDGFNGLLAGTPANAAIANAVFEGGPDYG